MVGAIHGRLLTAWATAGILGPVVVNYMREYQLALGIPREQVYNQTMMVLAGMLMVGLICNLSIRPVADKWFMDETDLAEEKSLAHESMDTISAENENGNVRRTSTVTVLLVWIVVLLPLSWGIYKTLLNVSKFFH